MAIRLDSGMKRILPAQILPGIIQSLRVGALLASAWAAILILLKVAGYDIRRPRFESAGIAFGALLVCSALSRSSGERPTATRAPQARLMLLIVAFVAVASFTWALWLGPLGDDYVLHGWAWDGNLVPEDWSYVRPLPLGLWWLALHAGASWPALHSLNIACHAGTAVLLSVLSIRVFNSRFIGGLTAASFVLFPASIEAVGWTAGVFDSVMTLSVVAAVVIFALMPHTMRTLMALSGLMILGLLTKETAVALPLLLLALVPLAKRLTGTSTKRLMLSVLVIGLIAGAYMAVRSSVVGDALTDALPQTRWQVKNMLVRPYAALLLPFYDDEPVLISSAAAFGMLALFTLALVPRERSRRLTNCFLAIFAGLAWVLASSLPLLREFYVGGDLQGSRYAYLPLAGFSFALAGALKASTEGGLRWPGLIACSVTCAAWLSVWPAHVSSWRQAAATRDALAAQAQQFVTDQRCSALAVQDAPDNIRGAYVFRLGLPQVLRQLRYIPNGHSCFAGWREGQLVPLESPRGAHE